MFGWEEAIVILGVLGTITVALIKGIPLRRTNGPERKGDIEEFVRAKFCDERSGSIQENIKELKSDITKLVSTTQEILVEVKSKK